MKLWLIMLLSSSSTTKVVSRNYAEIVAETCGYHSQAELTYNHEAYVCNDFMFYCWRPGKSVTECVTYWKKHRKELLEEK